MLDARNISVARKNAPLLAFPDLSVEFDERVVLLGPSGCGKTTLLSVIAGLLRPTSGTVNFHVRDVYAMSPRARDKWRGRNVGCVFQTLHLLPALTLRQNIALAADMAGTARYEDRIDELLATLGLAEKAHRKPDALSQGEQQRAAIARAVLNKPQLLLADEPTSALDEANADAVMDLLVAQAAETKAALVVATHDTRILSRFTKIIRLDARVKEIA